ncbi:uncharacterized protein [Ptychodera flava]|uniref:uncharacterized protein n=1 Tax=Ptychodera flava TaxID=63121 RepID=UPI00396A75D9
MEKLVLLMFTVTTLLMLFNVHPVASLPVLPSGDLDDLEENDEQTVIDPSQSRLLQALINSGFKQEDELKAEPDIVNEKRNRRVLQVCIDWRTKSWKWCYYRV